MDRIARIRQEIERRINILTNVYDEQLERKDDEMMTYYHGKVIALEELRPFLDTLSEEPDIPEFPETFEICLYDGRTPDNEKCTECSTTCSVRKEEPDKSLEEAAKQFVGYDMDTDNLRDYEVGIQAYIAGAEWQKSQMPMPEDTVLFQKGVEEGKRLMMEEAVEGEVVVPIYEGNDVWSTEIKIPGRYELGDKVRIIVLKAEE